MSVEIRTLSPEDVSAYRALRLQALTDDANAFLTSAQEYSALPLGVLREQLSSQPDGNFTLGAFLDGQLVGMSTFLRERRSKIWHKGKVVAVYVAPVARNQGIARKLMEALIGRARRYEGIEQIQLTVTQTQVAARKLYESLGFRVFALERKALKLTDGYLDEEYWVLNL